jgi:hypothetical protein
LSVVFLHPATRRRVAAAMVTRWIVVMGKFLTRGEMQGRGALV